MTDEEGAEYQLFEIVNDEDENGVAYLSTLVDLEGYYGNYTLIIQVFQFIQHNLNVTIIGSRSFQFYQATFNFQVNDFGEPMNTENYSVTLEIEKYSYYAPDYLYPENPDGERVYLRKVRRTDK